MGQVIVSAKIENLEDVYAAYQGLRSADQIRTLEVDDALVEPRAIGLMIPTRLLGSLGLRATHVKLSKTASGFVPTQMYEAVRLAIQGRECSLEVHEIPDPSPVIIGMIPLGALDWVVDTAGQKLIGNPEHGGQHIVDVLGAV